MRKAADRPSISRADAGRADRAFDLGFCSLLLVPGVFGSSRRTFYWVGLPIGIFAIVMFFRDSARIWGWKLEMRLEGLRIRRYYRLRVRP